MTNNITLIRLLHLSFWAIYLVLYTWIFSYFLPIQTSVFRGLLNGLPLMLLVYANIRSVNQFFEKKKYLYFGLVAVSLFFVMIPMRLYLNQIIPIDTINSDLFSSPQSNLIGIVFTNILFLLVSSFYQILVNRFAKEKSQAKQLQVYQASQLAFLKAQINPHFLFNTLNNIYSLAVKKSEHTAEMVVKLSHLLRYAIYQSQESEVSLKNEIDHIKKYIELFDMRSQLKPNISLEINHEYGRFDIEPMILITLVENSIKHCDFDYNDKAYIKIIVSVNDDILTFSTENSYITQPISKGDRGIGLENIKTRLSLLYNDNFKLSTDQKNNIFKAKLIIPNKIINDGKD